MALIAAQEMCGSSQRKNGTMNRDVCAADKTSVDPRKIKIIQAIAGIQRVTNVEDFIFNKSRHLSRDCHKYKQAIANGRIERQL